jgi:glycolate oxidase FAD binding subunit
VSAISERVHDAYETRRPLRIRGGGTWLDAGRPTRPADTLSLAEHRGIVEYVPGDLTMTARAGTPLGDIVAAASEHDQWLPLDPWGGDGGTLGATVSTGTAGPHALAMGLPRDVVLGMEFVTGTGAVIRSGGRVVKNVAGFDLTRLLVGSWGTLGVITEVTVRLRARPEETRTVAITIPTQALGELSTRLRALPFVPLASELINATVAARRGLGARDLLLCRVGGNHKSVEGQLELLRALGDADALAEEIWPALRTLETGLHAVWRWSHLPTRFADMWRSASEVASELGGLVAHGNPARGVVRVAANGTAEQLARAMSAFAGTLIIEKMPTAAWRLAESRVADDSLSRSIRQKFDPRGVLNAGILGGGAA